MKLKTKWEKILITTTLITAGIVMIGGNTAKAALQANISTHNSTDSKNQKTPAVWIEEIRKMETAGQTMGLTETIGNDLVATSESNNIDVHMIRTTEYGAMAILSASGFGNPNKLSDSATKVKSTTGNVTGVYVGLKTEWTAGVRVAKTIGKNTRYYDLYTATNSSAKVGDAIGTRDTANPGCTGWHGADSQWIGYDTRPFLRGGNYKIFTFYGSHDDWTTGNGYSRGVAVVGANL